MDVRKWVAATLAVLLLGGVGGGIWYSNSRVADVRTAEQTAKLEAARQVSVRGLIGSEKEAYFADPRVVKALAAQGITVTVEKAGSRAIAARYDASKYDFGFPSGAPAAVQLKAQAKAAAVFNPFYTPMVFASWRPIAEILVANASPNARATSTTSSTCPA